MRNWRDLSIDARDRFRQWRSIEHRAIGMQHGRQRIWAARSCHRSGNAIQFRECRKSWRVEKIDIVPSEDVCLFAMVSEGILRAQCFVSCVTIRSRPDNPCENDPRIDDLPCYVPQQFHRSGVHALDIACPFTACTPRGRPKLDRQSVSNCYLSVALVNAPKDLTSRFVSEQL